MAASVDREMVLIHISHTLHGTAIGLPISWGGLGGQWGGSPMAVPWVVPGYM